jgi:hypothetical protein
MQPECRILRQGQVTTEGDPPTVGRHFRGNCEYLTNVGLRSFYQRAADRCDVNNAKSVG